MDESADMTKILISVDIEGIAAVFERQQAVRGNPEYERARRLMTAEADAAVRGAFAGGATEVTVVDSHGPMGNLIAEDLDPRARVITGRGRPLSMIQGLTPDHAGVVLIGWHASAGEYGQFAHTLSSQAFRRIRLNGAVAGETTLYGGYAAELGVPLLLTSGDDRYCAEVQAQFPLTETVCVKNAIGMFAADCLSPYRARDLIEDAVRQVVQDHAQARVQYPVPAGAEVGLLVPFRVEVEVTTQFIADGLSLLRGVERLGAETVAFTAADMREVLQTLAVMSLMGASLQQ